ncbi:MAG: hypothetical protein V7744_01835 [Pseudomonadales bacterium]
MAGIFREAHLKMQELRANEKASVEQIQSQNLIRFRELAQYAYQKSAYYQGVVDDNKIDLSTCTPMDFPILTKQILLENFDLIATEESLNLHRVAEYAYSAKDPTKLLDDKFVVVTTSGSSGPFGYFVYTLEEALSNTFHVSRFFRKPGRRVAFVGIAENHRASVVVANIRKIAGLPSLGAESKIFDCHSPVEALVKDLNAYAPDMLTGFTKSILTLAEEKRRGVLTIQPVNVQVSGEAISDGDRDFLEQVFNCNVTNVYASCESLYMGFRRSDMQSMCLLEDDIIFEVAEEYTCITPLFNKTIPLIRYRIEDRLRIDDSGRDHKYPFLHIDEIIGRQDDVLELRNKEGNMVPIHPFLFSNSSSKYLRQMQVREISDCEVSIIASTSKGLSSGQLEETEASIRLLIDSTLEKNDIPRITINIEFRDHIPPDPVTGKVKIVIKKSD